MKPYELMDLRATTSDTYWTTIRSWLTVTFACFSAANLIGGAMGDVTYVVLFCFYGATSVSMSMYLKQLRKEIVAVESDLAGLAADAKLGLTYLNPTTINSRVMMVGFQNISVGITLVVFAGYLWALSTYASS